MVLTDMPTQRIETLTWVLIYGGLLSLSLGWFVTPLRGPWGELMMTGGIVSAVVGIVLIFVRSKMKP
jgi:hypothetical protein